MNQRITCSEPSRGLPRPWRLVLWGTLAAPLLFSAVAMQFTAEVNWGPGDFVLAAALLGLTGLGLELAARARLSRAGRIAAGGAILALLLVIWAELAVGLFR